MTRILLFLLVLLSNHLLAQLISLPHPNTVYDVAVSEKGNLVAVAGKDSAVYVYTARGELLSKHDGLRTSVSAVRFGFNDSMIFASDYDGNTYRIDSKQNEVKSFGLHKKSILDIMVLKTSNIMITSARDNTAVIWSEALKQKAVLAAHEKPVRKSAYSQKIGLVTVADDQAIIVWSLQGQLLKKIDQAHEAGIWELMYDERNDNFVTGDKNGNLSIWDGQLNKLKTWEAHKGPVSGLVLIDEYVVSSGMDGLLKVWSLEGNVIKSFEAHENYCSGLAISADQQLLVSSGGDGVVNIWAVDKIIK